VTAASDPPVAAVFVVISPMTVVFRLVNAGSAAPSDGALVADFVTALVSPATGIVSAAGDDGVVADLNFIV
jgi:hypothetical protein